MQTLGKISDIEVKCQMGSNSSLIVQTKAVGISAQPNVHIGQDNCYALFFWIEAMGNIAGTQKWNTKWDNSKLEEKTKVIVYSLMFMLGKRIAVPFFSKFKPCAKELGAVDL